MILLATFAEEAPLILLSLVALFVIAIILIDIILGTVSVFIKTVFEVSEAVAQTLHGLFIKPVSGSDAARNKRRK